VKNYDLLVEVLEEKVAPGIWSLGGLNYGGGGG